MTAPHIVLSRHAERRMRRRRVTLEDVRLVLEFGEHVEGRKAGTREACADPEGRPVTVVYDSAEHQRSDVFHVITVIGRGCT